jgi:V/A-type H+/Na+-transporting ATPase subunit I
VVRGIGCSMGWRDSFETVRMERVAIVAPAGSLRDVLVAVGDAGAVQVEVADGPDRGGPATEALERALRRREAAPRGAIEPALAAVAVDPARLAAEGHLEELAGEAELERTAAAATRRGDVVALAGWAPARAVAGLAARLASLGGALVRLPVPRGAEPPSLIDDSGVTGAFQPLVDTYVTVPYADLNPSSLAGIAYVVMFGMMFGDLGHGAIVAGAGLLLASGRPKALAGVRHLAPFVIGAGLASMAFGLAFGEAFGPTHLVPTLWLAPLDHPTTLLAVAIAAGAGLLACSFALGTANRLREGGPASALYSTAGVAGCAMYAGLATVGLGWYARTAPVEALGGVVAAGGFLLGSAGLYLGSGGGGSGAVQAGVEMYSTVTRLVTNTVSFARLAAFGLTHAALAGIVWSGTVGLWHRGGVLVLASALVFAVGNAVALALEGLVAAVQALRLEYYELFSRIYLDEGRRFRPWHVPTSSPKEVPCSPG